MSRFKVVKDLMYFTLIRDDTGDNYLSILLFNLLKKINLQPFIFLVCGPLHFIDACKLL